MKTLTIICAILALGWGLTYLAYSHRGNKIEALEAQNNALRGNNKLLEKSIEEEHKKALEASDRLQALETAAKDDKTGFDWSRDISNSPIVIRLRKD